jgi:hypothetical protein
VLTLAHHADDGFQAYAIVDRVETVRPITHDEAANLAAQTGTWTVYRRSDGALLSLDPAIYAGYAAYGVDAASEARRAPGPPSYRPSWPTDAQGETRVRPGLPGCTVNSAMVSMGLSLVAVDWVAR